MKHEYDISGMTCQSCASKIKQALEQVEGIEQVNVDLDQASATIQMTHHVSTVDMNSALKKSGNYIVTEKSHKKMDSEIITEEADESYSFKPLIMVLGFVLLLVLIGEYNSGEFNGMRAMQNYMGGFFIAFSFFKLLDLKGFAYNYLSYDIVTKKWMTWGFVYPFVELAFGIAYLTSFQLKWTAIATIIVMGLSSIGVIKSVLDKQKIKCACLGTGFNLPMSTVTIIEDVGMVVMAIVLLLVS